MLLRPNRWWCPACALGGLGMLVLAISLVMGGSRGLGPRLRVEAEAHANQVLAEAGFPWAKLEIDGAIGRLHGQAPDFRSRTELLDVANRLLVPMMGLPGVFARLDDGAALAPTGAGPASPMSMRLAQLPGGVQPGGPGLDASACSVALANVLQAAPLVFGRGTSTLAADSALTLERLAGVLGRCSPARVTVHGHTDRRGSPRANQRLSQLRAQAVLDALRQRGLAGSGHAAVGWGATQPLDEADSEAAYALNRRIEIKVETDVP